MVTKKFALPIGTILKSRERSYRVVEVLGTGGFGITYKVMSTVKVGNVELTTPFAIKELFQKGCDRGADGCTVHFPESLREDIEESRKDFITEARRLNKLSGLSRNIVQVNEVFEYFGTAYYVMKYLDGGELAEFVRNHGALSEAKALSIIVPIAKAVETIHRERLLHLDIKPNNIVLTNSIKDECLVPVLIDFGIAKHFSSSGKPTSTKSAKGVSEGYSPMEQYDNIDSFAPEIDVYAIGATLLFLLTGKKPKKAFEIKTQDIIESIPESVSPNTREAILKAMSPYKRDRTPTMTDFLKSLKGQYTLNEGFVLNSASHSYEIVEVEEEYPSYIVYKALLINEEQNHDISLDKYEDSNNDTVSLKDSTENLTYNRNNKEKKIIIYRIYELYDKNTCERNPDGSVKGVNDRNGRVFSDILQIENKNKPNEKELQDNYPKIEEFHANNTRYLASRILPKLSIGDKLVSKGKAFGNSAKSISNKTTLLFRKFLKPILYIICGVVVCFGVFFAAKSLYRSREKSAKEEPAVVKDNSKALDSLILKAVAAETTSLPTDSASVINNETALQESEKEKPKELSDDEKYQQAKANGDYSSIVTLASNGYAKAYYDAANYYFGRKNYTKAKKYAQQAVQANVNKSEAQQLISKIENLQNPPAQRRDRNNQQKPKTPANQQTPKKNNSTTQPQQQRPSQQGHSSTQEPDIDFLF